MKSADQVEFDGYALLQEQADFLASSSPADINSTTFLKVKLASQQKRTAQRNQFNRSLKSGGGVSNSVAVPSLNSTGGLGHNNNSFDELPLGSQNNSFGVERKSWGSQQLEEVHIVEPVPLEHGAAVSVSKSYGSAPRESEEYASAPASHYVDPNAPKHALDDIPAVASGVRASMPEVEEVVLIPCPYCGRNFAQDRIERHCIACMKLNKMDAHRKHKQQQQQQRREAGLGATNQTPDIPPATDWRKQSSQLRGALNGEPVEDDRVPCPYCRRRFAAETASRHIPLCKEKMTRMKQ